MRSALFSTLLLTTTLLLVPSLTLGAPSAKKRAAQSFKKGKKLFEERDYVGALDAFEQTYALHKHHVVLCNIARCHERLSNMIKAAEYFDRCLKAGAGKKPKLAARVQGALRLVRGRIGHARVTSKGKGGMVYVDGEQEGPAPREVALNPGRRIIEVRREGARAARAEFYVRGGERRSIELVPVDLARPVVATVPVVVTSRPLLPPKEPPPVQRRRKPVSQLWFWATVAVTAGAAAAAVVFSVQARAGESDFKAKPTRAGYDDARQKQLLANIFWGVTGAAGAGATVLFFFTDFGGASEQRSAGRRAPMTVGVALRGAF